jgi:3-oxoacyl-[acyl-carrier-protein] synthase II
MMKRVVVTGYAAISPLGVGADALWDACCAGRSGVGYITRFDAEGLPTRIAAEVRDFDPTQWMDSKMARRCDRFALFALAASLDALKVARLEISEDNATDVGVLLGSGIGGMSTWEEQHANLLSRGPSRVSPFFVPMMIVNMGSGMVSIVTGARGPNSTVATACATGTNAIGDAASVIRRGGAKAMIAGGSEAAITPLAIAGFSSARALSRRNDEPTQACRPFDRDRDGFVMGEGATVVILEEMEWARARGATIHAELLGYGMSGDAYHMTAPSPDGAGAVSAMQAALDDAGLAPADIGYINAHAPGTLEGDEMEARAIAWLFGDAVPVSSTKPIHGHQLGATGASELVICIKAIQAGLMPHTLNCDNPSEGLGIDIVRGAPRTGQIRYAMSNSFGFGGHNAVLVVSAA